MIARGSKESRPAGARTVGTLSAMGKKSKPKPVARPRRKRAAKSVTPLPEQLTRLMAEAAIPEQGGSPAPAAGIAAGIADGPAPAPPAQTGWPDEAGEPGK